MNIMHTLGYGGAKDYNSTRDLLKDPNVNAHVAKYFFDHSGLHPWTTAQGAMARTNQNYASNAVQTAQQQGLLGKEYTEAGSSVGGTPAVADTSTTPKETPDQIDQKMTAIEKKVGAPIQGDRQWWIDQIGSGSQSYDQLEKNLIGNKLDQVERAILRGEGAGR